MQSPCLAVFGWVAANEAFIDPESNTPRRRLLLADESGRLQITCPSCQAADTAKTGQYVLVGALDWAAGGATCTDPHSIWNISTSQCMLASSCFGRAQSVLPRPVPRFFYLRARVAQVEATHKSCALPLIQDAKGAFTCLECTIVQVFYFCYLCDTEGDQIRCYVPEPIAVQLLVGHEFCFGVTHWAGCFRVDVASPDLPPPGPVI